MLYRSLFLFIIIFVYLFWPVQAQIKKAEFSGSWYPAKRKELNALLNRLYNDTENIDIDKDRIKILGVIVPHAGYMFSAPIAMYSFKTLYRINKDIKTIVILAPSHRYLFKGIDIYHKGMFQTPIGNISVDEKLANEFRSLKFVQFEKKYFEKEHSVEIELPFIKKYFNQAKIIPILFGEVTFDQIKTLARKLKKISQRNDIIILVSSDMSHYHKYEDAVKLDKETIQLILEKNSQTLWDTRFKGGGRACGIYGIITFLEYIKLQGGRIKILKYANSGDTFGNKNQVVGYLSVLGYITKKEDNMDNEFSLSQEEKKRLLKIARETIENFIRNKKISEFNVTSEKLKEKRGVFVTLKKNGKLRGCIGRIVSNDPLYITVSKMAIESALHDPRFPPVREEELNDIEIEISVLSPFELVKDIDEIEVGKHGLIIQKGFAQGLLLPQVPVEWGWDKTTFLENLSYKAGLPKDAYKTAKLYRFTALVFSESDFLTENDN